MYCPIVEMLQSSGGFDENDHERKYMKHKQNLREVKKIIV